MFKSLPAAKLSSWSSQLSLCRAFLPVPVLPEDQNDCTKYYTFKVFGPYPEPLPLSTFSFSRNRTSLKGPAVEAAGAGIWTHDLLIGSANVSTIELPLHEQ